MDTALTQSFGITDIAAIITSISTLLTMIIAVLTYRRNSIFLITEFTRISNNRASLSFDLCIASKSKKDFSIIEIVVKYHGEINPIQYYKADKDFPLEVSPYHTLFGINIPAYQSVIIQNCHVKFSVPVPPGATLRVIFRTTIGRFRSRIQLPTEREI